MSIFNQPIGFTEPIYLNPVVPGFGQGIVVSSSIGVLSSTENPTAVSLTLSGTFSNGTNSATMGSLSVSSLTTNGEANMGSMSAQTLIISGSSSFGGSMSASAISGTSFSFNSLYPKTSCTASMTGVQIQNCYNTPVLAIPAPPSGYAIIPTFAYFELIYGGTPFVVNNNDVVGLQYGDVGGGAGPGVVVGLLEWYLLNPLVSNSFGTGGIGAFGQATTPGVIATGMYLTNTIAPITGGDGSTVSFYFEYYIVPMT